MNRVIKFRIWDCKHDCMYNPDIFDEKIVIQIGGVIGLFNGRTYDTISIDRFKLMQFINTQDGNGNDIYDGDILKAPSGNLFIVKWYQSEMRWAIQHMDTWYNLNAALYRVIGNIHSNPELLNPKP